jgi:uncharacterized membrane protein
MATDRTFAASVVAGGLAVLVHAALTWPAAAVLAFFGGGAVVAFVAEGVVINLDWLEHHVGPQLVGVPQYVLFGWTSVVYVTFRVALLVTAGLSAVLLAAALATAYDVLVDHRGVEDGHWTYTDELPGPRRRGVPWWNYLGWFAISAVTASLAVPFL